MDDKSTAVQAPHYLAGLEAMNADKPLAGADREELARSILTRYEAGERMETIASGFGLKSADVLYRLMLEQCPDQWRRYQAARAARRLESAYDELRQSTDGVGLGRARETARFATWELERLQRRLYGTEQIAGAGAAVHITVNLAPEGMQPSQGQTIEPDDQ